MPLDQRRMSLGDVGSGPRHGLRGTVVSVRDDPFLQSSDRCLVVHEDGLVVIEGGVIAAVGPYATTCDALPEGAPVVRYPDALITAGFIDTHVHYPQLGMIGAYGEQLLQWLERYTFPTELAFADRAHADRVARLFLQELLRAGTTTAAVYCTVHPQSVDAFFAASTRLNTCMVAGKVLMDRNAPAALRDTARTGYEQSKALIGRWHGRGRQHYCVTPRFAATSTEAQLEAAGALLDEHEGLFLQTHLSENLAEVAWIRDLFPARANYLDVYAHAGLVRERSIFGHGIHLSEDEFCTCHATGAALAHCPTSNLFLGSGLFRLFDALDPRRPVRVGLGSDIGAGTTLSPLATLGAACKVAALNGTRLDAVQALYLATHGGARALHMHQRLGQVAPGFDADLCIIDLAATPLLRFRRETCASIADLLFVLMTIGDDRLVQATYVAGQAIYERDRAGGGFVEPAAG